MQKISLKIRSYLNVHLQSDYLFPNLATGLLVGFSEVIFSVSLGSLIFSGELASYLPLGIGIAIASLAITTLTISLTSSIPGIISGLQESPALIQGLIVAGLYSLLTTTGNNNQVEIILASLALICLMTGLFFFALGYFKLGALVRYIPYPVMGGFLAGTGWLLVQASIGVMTENPLSLSNISRLFQLDQLVLWVPGVALGVILVVFLKWKDHFLTMPGIIIGAIVVFYGALFFTRTTIEAACQSGLLLGGFSAEIHWQPFIIRNLTGPSVIGMLFQSGNIATVFILSVLNLMLNSTGLELAIKRDVDINHELKAAGIANLLSGLVGGMVGFQTLSESALGHRLKARGRLAGLVAGVIPILILLIGTPVLVYFPKFILGGLLFFLGLDFLIEWVLKGWSKLSRVDFGIVVLILVVIATMDFLTGVGIGLLATVVLFVANYSQINVVRHTLSGADIHSNVERQNHEWLKLKELGDHCHVMELQGYIFFGTAHALLECIKERISEDNRLPIQFLILDFSRVSGADSSAVFSFRKCKQLAESNHFTMVFTRISESVQKTFKHGNLFDKPERVRHFPDLDRGLEWCEDQLLDTITFPESQPLDSMWERLVDQGFPKEKIGELKNYLEKVQIEAGEYLIRQGEAAEELFFIESGRASVYLEFDNQKNIRLQTLSERIVVGELGLYIDLKRTASIIAEETCIAYKLTKSALESIKENECDLAAAIHEFIARQLARNLADTTSQLAALDR